MMCDIGTLMVWKKCLQALMSHHIYSMIVFLCKGKKVQLLLFSYFYKYDRTDGVE
jgi:hypothetical protein